MYEPPVKHKLCRSVAFLVALSLSRTSIASTSPDQAHRPDYRAVAQTPTPEIPSSTLWMLSQEVSKFLGVVGAHRESVDRFSSLTKKFYPSQHDYSLNLAVLSENSAQFGVSMDELNGAGQASTRNAAVVRATSVSPLLNQVKSGLKFKLSFANLFANSQNRVPKTVRYGLVLDKIEVGSPGEAHASITNEDVMGGTGSTKTVWKIGPLPETSDTPYLVNPAEAAGSWYGKIELPRFNFDTTISPASIPGAPILVSLFRIDC